MISDPSDDGYTDKRGSRQAARGGNKADAAGALQALLAQLHPELPAAGPVPLRRRVQPAGSHLCGHKSQWR